MSFLQPWLLWGLPLIGLPILIHLMNQRRFQTIDWGAMYFLLAANRMARGFAKIRRWLILAARSLVVAGIIFAIARPLSSGWLGLAAGNRTDTTIVILDRSPSMSARDANHVATKLTTGKQQLAAAFEKLKSNHWVLIDSVTGEPTELTSAADLLSSVQGEQSGASADLPALLQTAHQYVQANQTGRTDIWICSDSRFNDWDAEGGRWGVLRDSFSQLSQAVRFYVLDFAELPAGNRSIRVKSVARRESDEGAELLLSLEVRRSADLPTESLPIELNIDGARSVVNVDLAGPVFELVDYRVPLGGNQASGWGRVSLPSDALERDNEYFFVFDREPVRRTLIVTDDVDSIAPIQLATEIPTESALELSVETISPHQLDTVSWEEIGLVVWKAALPRDTDRLRLRSFVDAEGQVIFLPPKNPTTDTCFGFQWGKWQTLPEEVAVATWRGDAGLLAHTQDGSALPVGELSVKKICSIDGEAVRLASLSNDHPHLVRIPTVRGAVYALATTTAATDSSLAMDGVVLYVAMQRALANGAARLASARQVDTGSGGHESVTWEPIVGGENGLSHQRQYHDGVYKSDSQLFAFNRSAAEDEEIILSAEQLDRCFAGLSMVRVAERAGTAESLLREVWRLFVIAMLGGLVAEAALCLPKRPTLDGALK